MYLLYIYVFAIPPLRGISHIYTQWARGQGEYKCDMYWGVV